VPAYAPRAWTQGVFGSEAAPKTDGPPVATTVPAPIDQSIVSGAYEQALA